MGLDFSHTEAHWSYGGFNNFRTKLAAEIGIVLDIMQGFVKTDDERLFRDERWNDHQLKPLNGDYPRVHLAKFPMPWGKIRDPIVPLLYHSDCDGQLSPTECGSIAPRLRELVEDWEDGETSYDKYNALLLADGMEEAAKRNEPLEFC
jgi:hypothetical protein